MPTIILFLNIKTYYVILITLIFYFGIINFWYLKMRALVTGGADYIGSVVSNYLLDKGHHVTIIDNLSTGSIKNLPKKRPL